MSYLENHFVTTSLLDTVAGNGKGEWSPGANEDYRTTSRIGNHTRLTLSLLNVLTTQTQTDTLDGKIKNRCPQ